jgi:hypothetical protein
LGGRRSVCHATELTHRANWEFDLHQMAKGCQAAFWIQTKHSKLGWVVMVLNQCLP